MEANTNKNTRQTDAEETMINPLRAEKVYVRFVPRKGGPVGDRKDHVLSGGMAEGATLSLCVPVLSSTGKYKNPLTNSEKKFLEDVLGLDNNALSIYKTQDNYWDNFYVEIGKSGRSLDLSDPEQYIMYKVLLLNDDVIAKDLDALRDEPKTTYQFVLVKEGEEDRAENAKMDTTMACYKEFGRIDDDVDTMRILVELLDKRPYSPRTKPEAIRSRINQLIQDDPRLFLNAIKDPMLHTKMIIRRGVELRVLAMRNDFYYIASNDTPLADVGEDSTLPVAARWLNMSAHSDIKAMIEAEVIKARNS